ncbi:MAG: nitrophenyl compound nitroreductase subunit ArsF family protein [Cyclobacteriaceae bacterium]|nr:nitrophenyl compound nitroreductase subunit ArsF family protein [Cyclobacteriaceae bacterium]
MKQLVILGFSIATIVGGFSCNAQADKKTSSSDVTAAKVEVYYFHATRRCMTCNAVETESKSAIEALYPDQVKNGTITFMGLNFEEESSKTAVEKAKADGQSLLIVSGDKRIDLTSQGFMYAVSNPEKLQQEIKKAVDPLLL